MTVTVANTNLNNSFNSWRLNTNLLATVMSNNVVTVMRDKTGQGRGGSVTGNAHISGTFSATTLRTGTLRSGNTTDAGGWLYVNSNTSINATSLAIVANTTIAGNVTISTTGSQVFNVGDISRLRISGGSTGQYLRKGTLGKLDFEYLTLRQITDLSSNSAHLILSAANTTFSDNGDSPHLRFSGLTDKVDVFLAADVTAGDSDLYIKLVDADGDSTLVIADSANNRVAFITSDGEAYFTANVNTGSVTANGNILPGTDDSIDLGAPNREFRNLYIDGTANIDVLDIATGASQGVSSSLIPTTDAVGNLGSSTRKWGTAWADTTNGGAGVFKTVGISQTLNANGNATIGGTLGVTGDATFNGNMTLGDTDADTITVKGKFANLAVTGVASFNGTTYMNGALYLNGNVYVGNQLTDSLQVTANTDLTGDVVIGDSSADHLTVNSQVSSDLVPYVNGGSGHRDIGTNAARWNAVYANTAYANNIVVDNNVNVNGDLTVVGAVNFSSGAVTAPAGTFASLTVNGLSNLKGNVDLGDASADTISVIGVIDTNIIPQTATRRDLGSSGSKWHNVYANNVTVGDEMTVTNRVSITKNLQVSGNTNIDGNITADGTWRNDSTVIIGSNAKLHANNTITNGTITNAMLANSKLTFRDGASGNTTLVDLGDTVSIYEGEGIDVFVNSDSISIHGEDASTSNKGIASFSATNFSVSSGAVSIKSAGVPSTALVDTGVVATSYGSATAIPVITVNSKGQITSATTSTVAGVTNVTYTQSNNVITVATAAGSFKTDIDAATTTSGTGRGLASFDSGDFSVSSGHVSLANGLNGAVLAINGTTNEVNVSRSNGTVTVGLPDDVTITGQLNVGENIVVSGNLVVQGTTTTVNSETVNIADNLIVLNSNYSGSTPTEDAGIVVERGTKANYQFIWDESEKRWSTDGRNLAANNFIGNLTGNASGSAATLANARSIGVTLTGDVTGSGSANFDGSGNITISAATTYNNNVVLGTDTSGNYVATITDSAGIDISGSGSEGAAVTVSLDLSELTTSTSDGDGDYFIVTDTSGVQRKLTKGNINLSGFNNDAGFSTTSGTVTSITVTAGDGLTGGGTVTSSGSVTLNVGVGAGLDVAADAISIESDLRGDMWQMGRDTNDYYIVNTTTHDWYLDGVLDMRLENDGDLHCDGDVVAYSTTTSSDRKLKENITTVENALDKLLQLNGVEFTWKKDGTRSAGVIAQDVEKVLPQAVKEVNDLNTGEAYKTVKYDALHALLIESIRELKAEIDELKKNK